MKEGQGKRKINSAALLIEYVSFNKKKRDRGFYWRDFSDYRSEVIETSFIANEVLILAITVFVNCKIWVIGWGILPSFLLFCLVLKDTECVQKQLCRTIPVSLT